MTDKPEQPGEQRPGFEITGDDDWKERVKAEAARLDAEMAAQQAQASQSDEAVAEQGSSDDDAIPEMDISQLPPASFTMLVQMFSTQAMVAMGVIPSPDGKPLKQMALAKHFIDLLAVLEDKCQGNLDAAEHRLLDQSLHELRLAFIQLSRQD